MVDGSTVLCGVIGNPVAHSMSPAMHNAAFESLGLNYVYLAFRVEDTDSALRGFRALGVRGVSVTIPHKLAVMKGLDHIDETARRIGAVNTITNENGRLLGTNTDGLGALRAVERKGAVEERRIVILGVGGTSRAIAFTLVTERKPKHLVLVGRKPKKTMDLADELRKCAACPISVSDFDPNRLKQQIAEADIVINTTPIGMYPNTDESPVPGDVFGGDHFVFDAIYNPMETLMLRRAREAGAQTMNGIPMFVGQGAEQFRLWTGVEPPTQIMTRVVEETLSGRMKTE